MLFPLSSLTNVKGIYVHDHLRAFERTVGSTVPVTFQIIDNKQRMNANAVRPRIQNICDNTTEEELFRQDVMWHPFEV